MIGIGKMSDPATKLIEVVANAIQGGFKPFQMKRIAKAECEIEVLKAKNRLEIAELENDEFLSLEKRSIKRMIHEEMDKQINIEMILDKATSYLIDEAKPENLEKDWILNFFDRCNLTSDEEMQQLWARVLAGEANVSGTFSKRVINLISSLDKKEAQTFEVICNYLVKIQDMEMLVILNYEHEIFKKHGISFNVLQHMDDIGLIRFTYATEFARLELGKEIGINYFNNSAIAKTSLDIRNRGLRLGKVGLTDAGKQLSEISNRNEIEGFWMYVKREWAHMGLTYTPKK